MVRQRNELILGLYSVNDLDGPRDPLNQSSHSDMPRPQETECHCSPALTNWDRWRHFLGFVSLPTPTPFWNWITDFESCAAIPHNSIQALLEAQLLSNQMFWHSALLFGFAVSLTPLPATPAHSYTLNYPRNCITEMHSIPQVDHIRPPFFFVYCNSLQSVFWIPLTSFLLLLQFLHLLHWLSFECTLCLVRTSCSISVQTGF